MAEKLNTSTFKHKANIVHKGIFDYSSVEYINNRTKVTVICSIHGKFEQRPGAHLRGQGCPECGSISTAIKRTLSTTDFIEISKTVHGDRYNYSNSICIGADKKVKVVCYIHGAFNIKAYIHINGQGCPKCSNVQASINNTRSTIEFTEAAHKKHNNFYDYSKANYINSKTSLTITCPIHGDFEQTPVGHIAGRGCRDCGILRIANSKRSSVGTFINKSNILHANMYDYSKVSYVNNSSKVTIICPKHGEFKQAPNTHLSGSGCPMCSKSGFDPSKPGLLYYLSINNGEAYKIGITNLSISKRFTVKDLKKIRIVHQVHYKNGQDAYDEEQKYLKQFKEHKYIGPKLLSSGNTELFNIDILNINIGNI